MLRKISLGIDIHAERKPHSIEATPLQQAYDDFKDSRTLRPKTIEVYDGAMRRCFVDWLDKPINGFRKNMVEILHKQISTANGPRGEGKAQANQAMRLLRAVLSYAAITYEDADGKSVLPENPVSRLSQVRAWNKISNRLGTTQLCS